jgi:hypothetical protein
MGMSVALTKIATPKKHAVGYLMIDYRCIVMKKSGMDPLFYK